MQLLYRINRTGTTVVVVTHDREMVDKMRRRVIGLDDGRVVRDESAGMYADEESTTEFAARVRDEMGVEEPRQLSPEPRSSSSSAKDSARCAAAPRRASPPSSRSASPMLLLGVLIPVLQTTQRQDRGGPRPGRPQRLPLRRRDHGGDRRPPERDRGDPARRSPSTTSPRTRRSRSSPTASRPRTRTTSTEQLPGARNPLPRLLQVKPDDLDNLDAMRAALSPPGTTARPSRSARSSRRSTSPGRRRTRSPRSPAP